MKIGLTYDLKTDYINQGLSNEMLAEFDREDTVDAIEQAVGKAGHLPVRIGNIKKLVDALAVGECWDLVFNIAEGLYGPSRESQIPALLEAYRIPMVFSDSLVLSVCLHKGLAKSTVRNFRLPTPDFLTADSISDLDNFSLKFPVFCKPALGGTSQGIYHSSKCSNRDELEQNCLTLLEKFPQSVLIEEYLPGREFTVGILGTGNKARVVGALEVKTTAATDVSYYSYENKQDFENCMDYVLAEDSTAHEAEELALKVWKALGARDGGRIDLKCDSSGGVNFLEINPLAGLNPEISDLPILCSKKGISYQDLINQILESAIRRNGRK